MRSDRGGESPGADDRPPQPPQRPSSGDCCRSGCMPCVFDLYELALERYREALTQWQARRRSAPE